MDSCLQVCETFVSIQGESTFAGCPCFFIRLSGCNLRCAYCDTTYALSGGQSQTVAQLVHAFLASKVKLVEVTGGEPLIQRATPDLLQALCVALPDGVVLLETNGSQDLAIVPADVIAIVDIKCPGSGVGEAFDQRNLQHLRPQDEVKFVISGRADFDWAVEFMKVHQLAAKCRAVLFSPVLGRVAPAVLAQWLLASGVHARLNLQLHKLAGWR